MRSPSLIWKDGIPWSRTYQESYWSASGPEEECHHVFIAPAKQHLLAMGNPRHVRIGEVGFGFGHNFLTTLASLEGTHLDYVAVESTLPSLKQWRTYYRSLASRLQQKAQDQASPLDLNLAMDLRKRLARAQSIKQNDQGDLARNTIILDLPQQKARLTLLTADCTQLAHILTKRSDFDIWYLDGFSPRVNPESWSMDLLTTLVASAKPGASILSYSVATTVLDHLRALQCSITRRPGHPPKRYCLRARTPGIASINARSRKASTGRYPHLAVVGGGIAGSWCAMLAQQRGWQVTQIFTKRETPPLAFALPRLQRLTAPLVWLHMQAWSFLQDWCTHWLSPNAPAPFKDPTTWLAYRGVLWEQKDARAWHVWKTLAPYWPAQMRHLRRIDRTALRWPKIPVFYGDGLCTALSAAVLQRQASVRAMERSRHGIKIVTDSWVSSFDRVIFATGAPPSGIFSSKTLPPMEMRYGALACNPRLHPRLKAFKGSTLGFKSKAGLVMVAGFHHYDRDSILQNNQQERLWSNIQHTCVTESLRWGYASHTEDWKPLWHGHRVSGTGRRPVVAMLEEDVAVLLGMGSHGYCLAGVLAQACLDLFEKRPTSLTHDVMMALSPRPTS